MQGLVQKFNKFYWQAAIPADVRAVFEGKKKYQVTFGTSDLREAETLALQARRAFREKVVKSRPTVTPPQD